MYRIKILFSLLLLFTINFSCKQKEHVNVEEIWKKYIHSYVTDSIVKTTKTSYKKRESILKNNTIFISETYIRYPDKVYQKIFHNGRMVQTEILNGNKTRIKQNGKEIKVDEKRIAMLKENGLIFPEFYYSINDLEYAGEVKENEKTYYKIKYLSDNAIYLIDKQTYELYKIITDLGSVQVLKRKKTGGVLMNQKLLYIYGKDTVYSRDIDTRLNIPINDSIFRID
jgi:hypothetical protein